MNEPLHERLQRLMSEKGTNPTRLSRETGISQPTILRLTKGIVANPTISTLVALSNALGVSVAYLSTGIDNKATANANGVLPFGIFRREGDQIIFNEQSREFYIAINGGASSSLNTIEVTESSLTPDLNLRDIVIIDTSANNIYEIAGIYAVFIGPRFVFVRRKVKLDGDLEIYTNDDTTIIKKEDIGKNMIVVGRVCWKNVITTL